MTNAPILHEDATDLDVDPSSIVWRRSSDPRLICAAGYALLLQVGHPTIGAGVKQFSDYATDPWSRLVRTADYVYVMIYGGAERAREQGRQLREMHKRIQGVRPDGQRYHALEPQPFAWVHATLADAVIRANELFVGPMSDDDKHAFYREFRKLGALHGVRERDLPPDWAGFRAYFDDMVENHLSDNPAVQDLLATHSTSTPPGMSERLWSFARTPTTWTLRLTGRGMLPPILRKRFRVPWTASDERWFPIVARAIRMPTPLLPGWFRITGPTYMRHREHFMAGFHRHETESSILYQPNVRP